MKTRRFSRIVCGTCGGPTIECPCCADRGEYTLLCVAPGCGKARAGKAPGPSRTRRLEARKRGLGQCYKCPLGSTGKVGGNGLCDRHTADLRERWARVEARRKAAA
jgi:hypothetical protein